MHLACQLQGVTSTFTAHLHDKHSLLLTSLHSTGPIPGGETHGHAKAPGHGN